MTRLAARRVILGDGPPRPATILVEDGVIAGIADGIDPRATDLGDVVLAPGLVDIHGDAFARQLMPRPGVIVDHGVAMLDTDRQLAVHGITTAFHGITWSWEPGLRSDATAVLVVETLERARGAGALLVDHRVHVRMETFHLEGEPRLLELLQARRIDLLAFNDHTAAMAAQAGRVPGNHTVALRAMVDRTAFDAMALAVHGRAREVWDHIARVAAASRAAGVPMLSHDDGSPQERDAFRALGVQISEFPKNRATAERARSMGDAVVMGAPNAVRGRSHLGWLSAGEAIEAGLCTVLASDYWYAALLQVPFRLAERGALPLETAWHLVAAAPAELAGLTDRGEIAIGRRADLVAVDDRQELPPRAVGTWVGGRRVLAA